jgi:hypothetical protein
MERTAFDKFNVSTSFPVERAAAELVQQCAQLRPASDPA